MSRKVEEGNIPGVTEHFGRSRWVITDEGSLGMLEVRLEVKWLIFWRTIDYAYPDDWFDRRIETTESMVRETKKRIVDNVIERLRQQQEREGYFEA